MDLTTAERTIEKTQGNIRGMLTRAKDRADALDGMFEDTVAVFRRFNSELVEAMNASDAERALTILEAMNSADPIKNACKLNAEIIANMMAMNKVISGASTKKNKMAMMPTADIVDVK